MSICRRCARKQEPGSGGEHRDPGWLFRAYGEETRRSGNVPDDAGERITHSPVVTPACLHGATSPHGTAMLLQS